MRGGVGWRGAGFVVAVVALSLSKGQKERFQPSPLGQHVISAIVRRGDI